MFKIYTRNNMADSRLVSRKLGDASRGVERQPGLTNAAEAAGDLDLGVVEWWRPFGALVTQDFYCMCYVYNSGEPGWYESGERETTSVVSGHARAAVETVVDVPDHGDALSLDREETIMIIQFER